MSVIRQIFAACVAVGLSSGTGQAQSTAGPVVVELFTSQGCSSCPPADVFMSKLATRSDILPLALHVDYWDYLGWADVLASPQFTKRQKAYARSAGRKMIYTPQMIVGGETAVAGYHPMEIMDAVMAAQKILPTVTISARMTGTTAEIELKAVRPLTRDVVVQVVRYRPQTRVEIEHGENAGKTIDYVNSVTVWDAIGTWDGVHDVRYEVSVPGPDRAVVIVQEEGHRRILATAALR
ncbi:thioredoxin family protein [Pseudoruegeria sp. SK021]|uniref:DUF1223 domain-containing protein n=1 Tax=Pseudoruegeria sp. SK021 TaxID=1933035 RepID=UPI000A265850|nr:DUF1223 domain-containing protein [Pseudoruegeria sp. SK021]OSP56271.1 hypothetical protein BV911_02990 [Pseudoruegeria sp. SK021]